MVTQLCLMKFCMDQIFYVNYEDALSPILLVLDSVHEILSTHTSTFLKVGVMPKRGLDVGTCEIFRFYRLIAIKNLVEPLSMVVPRKQVSITPTNYNIG